MDLVFLDVVVDGKPYNAGRMDIGLCKSQVQKIVGQTGSNRPSLNCLSQINEEGVQCSYPPHAIPSVTPNNEYGFICFVEMPATNYPTSCVCPPNLMECDGVCGPVKLDCSTKPPPSHRQNQPVCAEHLTMCGVPDATWGQAYKCTDITSDSYPCGGCVKASPFGSPSVNGVNYHDIPNGDFSVSASEDGCVADLHGKNTRDLTLPMPDAVHILDSVYLPLHVVLPDGTVTIVGSVNEGLVPT
ncbi:hypothetical protein OG21DRAFT_1484608 [Imleria badia]|nr:hypothetical protein OG21DRAFT_1484608 [Imleria badia]